MIQTQEFFTPQPRTGPGLHRRKTDEFKKI